MNNKNTKYKIILAGTPEFASNIFEQIIHNFDVVAIITQPDKKVGRGKKIIYSPVKELSIKYNIPLFQPNKISDIKKDVKKLSPDLLLTCAYGQYIPKDILDTPKFNSINIHASLLPRHRGAAPIHYAIWTGDKETGITIMKMSTKMDCGDILFTAKTKILNKTTSELFIELSNLAKKNIVKWIERYFINDYQALKQDESKATYSQKIDKSQSLITSNDTVKETLLKIQAFNKFPGTYIIYKNQKLKVFAAASSKIENSLIFKLKDGEIYITEMQLPGRKRMDSISFLRGQQNG